MKLYMLDLVQWLHEARDFSSKTFGPGVRTKGIIKHIKKELIEIEEEPLSLEEWVDVAILAFDGAWRAGYEPEEIAAQLLSKRVENENREWPDWREVGENNPIEHIRREE
jgi:hypothetical protein